MGVISCLLALVLVRMVFPPATVTSNVSATGVVINESVANCVTTFATSTLFLGLPRAFLGGVLIEKLALSALSLSVSHMIFRLPVILGFGVPALFLGLSKDFLGLPLARFAAPRGVSSPALRGTVIVVVRSVRRLVGELFLSSPHLSSSTCSACTVSRICHGLVEAAFGSDLVGGLLFFRAGVDRRNSRTWALPDASTSGFLGVITEALVFVSLAFAGEGTEMFSFDKANGSGDESSFFSSCAILFG